ncbi:MULTISPECIES: phage tail protein [unclassified Cupriavidus]|uniref:phage tail protein n=1 Tax=unclassified Cupriavidus TaxID=2640874 RepID=UPI00313C4355
MPAAVAAAIAAAATAAGASAAVAAVAYAITYAVVSLAISYAVGSIMGAIFKPKAANGFSAEAQGRTQVVRSNVQPRNSIYGRAMTSGPLIFAASTDGPAKKNQFMHLVIALADHECDEIEEVYLGEDAANVPVGQIHPVGGRFKKEWGESVQDKFYVTGSTTYSFTLSDTVVKITSIVATRPPTVESDGQWIDDAVTDYSLSGRVITVRGVSPDAVSIAVQFEAYRSQVFVRVKRHLGSPDQTADPDLVAEVPGWTWDHRLRGVCYLYVRLDYDSDIFPNGLPNIKALVRGKRLYDPRYNATYWSDNWGLCIYDYLRDPGGFGCTDADIDVASVMTAINVSEETVDLGNGTAQYRYRCNGIVMSDKSPRDSLAEMVTAGGGVVTITGGLFRVFAGAYDIPTVTLTEADLRGPVKVRARTSRKDLFNRVKGTFVSPANSWQPSDLPVVGNPTYAAQDGEVIDRDIELPFTTDVVMAQRLGKIILERSRQGIVVEWPGKISCFQLTAYSTVKITLAKFGWTDKVFRVMNWKMSDSGGVDLILNEEAAAVYDWNAGNATVIDPAPDTNLPNPYLVENMGQINLDSGEDQLVLSQTGVVTSRILVMWPQAQESALLQSGQVEIQYKPASAADWIPLGALSGDSTRAYISPVVDGGLYQVRGRFVSALRVRSPQWSYSPVHTVVGKLAPPSNLTGLSLTVFNGFANLTWDKAVDLDVRNGGQARIRHTTDTVQPSWGSAIDIGGYVAGSANSVQLPLLEGVYLAKWIDSTGHESPQATMVITTAPSLNSMNAVAIITEHPLFAGAKTNVVRDPALNGIKLIGAGLIDSQGLSDATGLWDDQGLVNGLGLIDTVVGSGGWGLIDSLGGIVAAGSYQFANTFDLGVVETSRLTATIDAVSFDTGDQIDFRFDLIDSWLSIDGDRINDTVVALFVRTTNDNPAGSPIWSPWQRFSMGDYEARAFQWKVDLESESSTHNVLVTGLTVGIDMPDRRESGRDVVSSAGPTAITFSKAFRVLPNLGITAQNMAQGDYFVITSKTETGFTITFYNAASIPVSRRFDWDAQAY